MNLWLFFIAIAIVLVSFISRGKACWILEMLVGTLMTPPVSPSCGFLNLCPSYLICRNRNINAINLSSSSFNSFTIIIGLFRLNFLSTVKLASTSFFNAFLQVLQMYILSKEELRSKVGELDVSIPTLGSSSWDS